jgi:hypothetical protein
MHIDDLFDAIAEKFKALGATDKHVAWNLQNNAYGACRRIYDKYSRFTPISTAPPNGFMISRAFKEGDEFVAEVSIDAQDGPVRAAVIRYLPE